MFVYIYTWLCYLQYFHFLVYKFEHVLIQNSALLTWHDCLNNFLTYTTWIYFFCWYIKNEILHSTWRFFLPKNWMWYSTIDSIPYVTFNTVLEVKYRKLTFLKLDDIVDQKAKNFRRVETYTFSVMHHAIFLLILIQLFHNLKKTYKIPNESCNQTYYYQHIYQYYHLRK